jgi:hypothetical protein
MSEKVLGFVLVMLTLVSPARALALVVDFESAPTSASCFNHGTTLTTQGYTFTALGAGSNGLISCDGTAAGIGSSGSSALADNTVSPDIGFQESSGALFNLVSVDVGELTTITARNATQIGVAGFFPGGGLVQALFNLDGIVDGPGGAADFQTFVLPATFTGLSSARISFVLGGSQGSEFAIDDLNVQIVPMPSAVWLFASGVLALTGIARKRSV